MQIFVFDCRVEIFVFGLVWTGLVLFEGVIRLIPSGFGVGGFHNRDSGGVFFRHRTDRQTNRRCSCGSSRSDSNTPTVFGTGKKLFHAHTAATPSIPSNTACCLPAYLFCLYIKLAGSNPAHLLDPKQVHKGQPTTFSDRTNAVLLYTEAKRAVNRQEGNGKRGGGLLHAST